MAFTSIPLSKTIHASQRQGLMSTPIYNGPEGSSQTFKRGAPLVYSSGYLVVATTPIDTGDAIVGFALRDGANDTAHSTLPYVPALPHMVFEGVLSNASTGTHTSAQTDQGLTFAIDTDTSTKAWALDFSNTTNPSALVIALVDPIGTVDGRVRFVVVDDATAYGV